MYQVISANVIRQVIRFEGLPMPKLELTDNFKWPSGKMSCTYRATWSISEAARWDGNQFTYDGCAAFTRFLYALRGCFCPDITVTQLHIERGAYPSDDYLSAEIYCTLEPKVLQPVKHNTSTTRNAVS